MRKLGQKDQSENDPNVMTIEDGSRIRLVDDAIAAWKQHIIEHPKDDDQVVFVTCPGPRTCPLCRKPQAFQMNAKGEKELVQLFPVQRRRAANVWDYKTNQVKVMIGGPQIFNTFDDNTKLGVDPLQADYVISKSGSRMTTKYTLTRLDSGPMPSGFDESDIIDLAKYEQPDSVEVIFEKLDAFGIDYDSLPLPTFELDDALAFEMPYGKHKGMTLESIAAQDDGYLKYIHGSKLDQGALGDPVFQAMQTILEDLGEVQPLDDVGPTGTMPTREAQSNTSASAAPDMIKLLDQQGAEVEVPASAKVALLAAGYTEPVAPAPEPEPQADTVVMVMSSGEEVEVPIEARDAMLAAGASVKGQVEPKVERKDSDQVTVDIGGTKATMPWGTAKGLVDSGTAKLVQDEAPAAPQFKPPADDEPVKVKLNAVPNPIDMVWKDALRLTIEGQATLMDADQQAYAQRVGDSGDSEAVAAQAGAEQTDASAVPAPDDPDKPFKCEVCDKRFKAKGGLTQHMNREHPGQAAQSQSAPSGGTTASPSNGNGNGAGLLDEVKALVANSSVAKDYTKLLDIFQAATGGERNLGNMSDEQLNKVKDAIQAHEMGVA